MFNLKTLEGLCRDPMPNRDEFLRVAKEVAISIHGLMRLSQERGEPRVGAPHVWSLTVARDRLVVDS